VRGSHSFGREIGAHLKILRCYLDLSFTSHPWYLNESVVSHVKAMRSIGTLTLTTVARNSKTQTTPAGTRKLCAS
jgi:hypothetical protein